MCPGRFEGMAPGLKNSAARRRVRVTMLGLEPMCILCVFD